MDFEAFLIGLPNRISQGYILITTFAPDVEPIQLLHEFDDDLWLFETYAVLVAYRNALDLPNCRTDVINRLYQPVIQSIVRSWSDYMSWVDYMSTDDLDTSYVTRLISLQKKIKK